MANIKYPLITKEKFVKMIKFIINKDQQFEDLVQSMETVAPGFYCEFFPNYSYDEKIIELLNDLTGESLVFEDGESSLLGFFLYELEHGKAPGARNAYQIDGKNYPLTTPEELYDAIVALVTKDLAARNK